jgi:hypothetical protein
VDWSLSQQVTARQGRQPSPRGILHELLEAWNRSVTQLLRQKLHDPYPVVDFTDITAYSKVWVAAEKLRDRLVRHLLDVAPRV